MVHLGGNTKQTNTSKTIKRTRNLATDSDLSLRTKKKPTHTKTKPKSQKEKKREKTNSVLVNDLGDSGELTEAGTVVDQHNAANLNETLVSLFKIFSYFPRKRERGEKLGRGMEGVFLGGREKGREGGGRDSKSKGGSHYHG